VGHPAISRGSQERIKFRSKKMNIWEIKITAQVEAESGKDAAEMVVDTLHYDVEGVKVTLIEGCHQLIGDEIV
jgi:hypothetical protein